MYQDDNIQNVYEETLKENERLKREVELLVKLIEGCGLGEKNEKDEKIKIEDVEDVEDVEDEEKKVISS